MTWLDILAGQFVWPWAAENRARRLLEAMKAWQGGTSVGSPLATLYRVADGYYRAKDWIGVEATYIRAREHLDLQLEATTARHAVAQSQAMADLDRARARASSGVAEALVLAGQIVARSPATGGRP